MIRKLFLCVGLLFTLLACAVLNGVPTGMPAPSPSETPQPKETSTIVPSATPEPTETSAIALSDTPESAPILLLPSTSSTPAPTGLSVTPTPTQIAGLDCKLMWQSPANDSAYSTGQKFTAGWSLENSGTATWDAGSFEFIYLGGRKLDLGDVVHLETSVLPGQSVVLSVSMRAPQNPGTYTTYWGMRQGNAYFCRLKLEIYAQ